jgi:hypothetical protein
LKANRPTTMTGDLMLPALEILIMLRPSDRQTECCGLAIDVGPARTQCRCWAARCLKGPERVQTARRSSYPDDQRIVG